MADNETGSEPTVTVPLYEWNELIAKINDIYEMMHNVQDSVKPAIESLSQGGLFSMLMGRKK